MNPADKELRIFGYGLGLLIPFILSGPVLKLWINIYLFIGLFILLLVVINYVERIRLGYYLFLAGFYVLISRRLTETGLGFNASLFLGVSIVILLTTILKPRGLAPLYKIWMRVVHFFGNVVTVVLLTVFYYLAFGIPGIILKMLKKDLLARAMDPQAKSYWIKRLNKPFNKEDYTRQF